MIDKAKKYISQFDSVTDHEIEKRVLEFRQEFLENGDQLDEVSNTKFIQISKRTDKLKIKSNLFLFPID